MKDYSEYLQKFFGLLVRFVHILGKYKLIVNVVNPLADQYVHKEFFRIPKMFYMF